MGRKAPPGLIKRGSFWHIKKTIGRKRVFRSTGTGDLAEAERCLAHMTEQARQVEYYGQRVKRSFRQAATKYLNEATKASLSDDSVHLKLLDRFIGDMTLESVHMGSLQPFIRYRQSQGVKNRTINYGIQVVRRILNLASSEWIDEKGLTWLEHPPRMKFFPETDSRKPYPLSWAEESRLLSELPAHLAKMALFKVNTGCREAEVCAMRWEWEIPLPALGESVFVIPPEKVKNREPRLVVLNRMARAVIQEMRGVHPVFVFTYRGRPVRKMNGRAWRKARERAGLPLVRVHDLKHTFGRRLRAAGVSFEDRQDLLGHRSGKVTTHYSRPEIENLIKAANRVCPDEWNKNGTVVILKENSRHLSAVN